jgi:hypothetical protein
MREGDVAGHVGLESADEDLRARRDFRLDQEALDLPALRFQRQEVERRLAIAAFRRFCQRHDMVPGRNGTKVLHGREVVGEHEEGLYPRSPRGRQLDISFRGDCLAFGLHGFAQPLRWRRAFDLVAAADMQGGERFRRHMLLPVLRCRLGEDGSDGARRAEKAEANPDMRIEGGPSPPLPALHAPADLAEQLR